MSNLKAGRELDAKIAELVMGHKIVPGPDELGIKVNITECKRIPHYSTDIAEAWGVVERLYQIGYDVSLESFKSIEYKCNYRVVFAKIDNQEISYMAFAESAPLAIVLAALKAVGYGEGGK